MAKRFVDYYRLLGIDPSADGRAIRSAYRRLARRYHPDVARDKRTASRFLLIREAYETLSDPEKRRQYDRLTAERPLRWRRSDARASPSVGETSTAVATSDTHGSRVSIDILGIHIDADVSVGTLLQDAEPPRRPRRTRRQGKR